MCVDYNFFPVDRSYGGILASPKNGAPLQCRVCRAYRYATDVDLLIYIIEGEMQLVLKVN